MLQRQYNIISNTSQRYGFEIKLQKSQQQLEPDFYQLFQLKQQIKKNNINQIQCSIILQQMIQKLTYPIAGIQILKDKFFQMNILDQTGFKAFGFIQEKAQHIYIQSIMKNLKKMQNQQYLQYHSPQSVKNIVQQMNWKISMEKQIHQSQVNEVGQHVDLMKFFQGVRNYQNWQQSVKKQTIEHLKQKAYQIQLNLTLKKGFLISKIQQFKINYERNYQKQFINKCKNIVKIEKINTVSFKMQQYSIKQAFNQIKSQSKQIKIQQKVGNLFLNYWQNKICQTLTIQISKFNKMILKNRFFLTKVDKIIRSKTISNYLTFLQRINLKKKIKYSKLTLGIQKINSFYESLYKRMFLKELKINEMKLLKTVNPIILKILKLSFEQIRKQSEENRRPKIQISRKTKGKILMQLKKSNIKPINIRQTFLNWHIKSNQQKFAKKMYNIWLTGNTSKFTFFMRLKNLINQEQNYQIKYQLKVFLMILNVKLNKYYNHCQKNKLQKWINNTRRIRKIQNSFKFLSNIQKESDSILCKFSFQKISNKSKANIIKQKFCNKYLQNRISNAKKLFDTWKIIPDVKRSKGQILIRSILNKLLLNIKKTKLESFSIFKSNKNTGRDKKINLLRKAFNQDYIYLQRYFQVWRFNKNIINKQSNEFKQKKVLNLLLLQKSLKKNNNLNLKDVITKFMIRSKIQKKKQIQLKQIFTKIIKNNENTCILESFNQFKKQYQISCKKKQNLVINLVQANKKKQQLTLNLIKNKAAQLTNLLKIKQTQKIFLLCEQKFKKNFSILNKQDFVFKLLNKIITNQIKNVSVVFNNIFALPNRIDWKKRNKAIKFCSTLIYSYQSKKGVSFSKFKQNNIKKKFKVKRLIQIMTSKYYDINRKYFQKYRNNIMKLKHNQIHKVTGFNFQKIENVLKQNYKNIFLTQSQWKIKSNKLKSIDIILKKRISYVYYRWNKIAKQINFANKIQNQKKKRMLENLIKINQLNELNQTKQIVHLFKKNHKIQGIQLNFLKRLCDGQAGKVVKALTIWKGLPQPKNKQLITRATKFEKMMCIIGLKNYKKTYNIFKDLHYFGNQKKKMCIRQLVAKSCSGLKGYFEQWRNNNKLSLIFGQCKKVDRLINISQLVLKSNFKLFFEGKQAQNKRIKVNQLSIIIQNQKKQVFNFWRNKISKLRSFDKKKTQVLLNLCQIQLKKQNKDVRDYAIHKFSDLRIACRIRIQKNQQVKALQFYDILNKKRIENMLTTLNIYKFNHIKGNFKKKRAFQNWLSDKIAQINSILGGWNNLSRAKKAEEKRMLVDTNMNSMHLITLNSFKILFSNGKENQIKRKSLNDIFKATQIKMKGFLLLWRNNVKQLKILGQLDKQAKASILERINKIVMIGSTQNVKKAIQKFHKSMKVQQVQKKFINQLLKTKSGMVIQAFKRWNTIPAINLGQRYKKAQKFYFKLQNLYKQKLGFTHQVFKKESEQGNLMKKQSILQLFEMTSTGIRRYYRRWEKMTKQRHTLQSVNELIKSVDTINTSLSLQWMLIFQDQRAYRVKINAINRLIAASSGTTSYFFNRWRQSVKQLKIQQSMDIQKKTLAVQMFKRVIEGSETIKIVQAIRNFKKNTIVTDISKKFFNRLLQTKTGKCIQVFQKLKSIPDAKLAVRKKKAIKFESSIHKFALKVWRSSYNPFKLCNYVANDRKKLCINKLVRISMGEQHKKFNAWRNVTRQDKILSHTASSAKSFEIMESIFFNNLSILFKNSKREVEKKKNLCRKLIMNSQFVQHHAFMLWKQTYRNDTIKIVKKQSKVKDFLRNLINIHENHQKKNTVGGFGSFRNILMLKKIKQATKYQQVKQQKSHKFFEYLQNISKKRLGLFIIACKNSSIQLNFANKIYYLQTLFKNSTDIYSLNMLMLMRNQRQSVIIQSALNRIFQNFKVGTQKAFNIWRQNIKIIKLNQLMSNDKKKNILNILNKFLGSNETNQVKNAVKLFHTNFKQTKIQKDILIKIMNCKAGKVPYLFMKWKALPDQNAKVHKKKAIKFQSTLSRTYFQRMKFVFNSYKQKLNDANIKKQFAIKKLIQATMSDTNRIFNKWRKINNQTKITEKVNILDKVFSFSQYSFMKNIKIYQKSKQQNKIKVFAIQRLFINQKNHLQDSLNRWIQQNRRYKFQKINSTLGKYTQFSLNKRFIKETFLLMKQKYEIQTMKGYVNSLWKWKMANTEANYYDKFIKVFRQSQELLNISKILNKKQSDNLHFAFAKIRESSLVLFQRKYQLVQKIMKKKISTYLNRIRRNAFKDIMDTWKGKYTQSIQVQNFCNVLAKISRKQLNQTLIALKINQVYMRKVQRLQEILNRYKKNNLDQTFKNIYRYGYFKIIKISYDTVNKLKQFNMRSSFENICNFSQMRKFYLNIRKVQNSAIKRFALNQLKKNNQKKIRQKLSLLLLSEQIMKNNKQKSMKLLNAFRKRTQKAISSQKLSQILHIKLLQKMKIFFNISLNDIKMVNLLQRFKKGTSIKNILQKQDQKLLKEYFNRLKKKQNLWVGESIRKFATRSSLRSSLAISLWRFKTFSQK